MIAFVVNLEIKPEMESEFLEAFGKLSAAVNADEPGCHLYQLARDPEKPGHYVVLERYEDDAAFQARVHGTAPLIHLDLIKNGTVLHRQSGDGTSDATLSFVDPELSAGDWVYLRAVQEDSHAAWASPIWIE